MSLTSLIPPAPASLNADNVLCHYPSLKATSMIHELNAHAIVIMQSEMEQPAMMSTPHGSSHLYIFGITADFTSPPSVPPHSIPPEPNNRYLHPNISAMDTTQRHIIYEENTIPSYDNNTNPENRFYDATNIIENDNLVAVNLNPQPLTFATNGTTLHINDVGNDDDDSMYNYYENFVCPHSNPPNRPLPRKVRLNHDSDSITKLTDMTTPFLTTTSKKLLPK